MKLRRPHAITFLHVLAQTYFFSVLPFIANQSIGGAFSKWLTPRNFLLHFRQIPSTSLHSADTSVVRCLKQVYRCKITIHYHRDFFYANRATETINNLVQIKDEDITDDSGEMLCYFVISKEVVYWQIYSASSQRIYLSQGITFEGKFVEYEYTKIYLEDGD